LLPDIPESSPISRIRVLNLSIVCFFYIREILSNWMRVSNCWIRVLKFSIVYVILYKRLLVMKIAHDTCILGL
jgi:hypothetical protein